MSDMGNQKYYRHSCRICGSFVASKNKFEIGIECEKCESKRLNEMKIQKEKDLATPVINNCIFCGKQIKTNLHDNKGFCNDQCDAGEKLRIQIEQKEQELQLLIDQNIPKKFAHSNYSFGFDINSLYNKSLFITGDTGVGKTTLMASLAKLYLKNRVNIKWISFASFIIHLQQGFKNNKNDPFANAIEVAEYLGIVMIDDLGAEKTTEYVRQIIYYILNEREQNCLPVVITSNFNINELSAKSDKRIASRIAGLCKQIKLTGKDRRIK